MAWLDIPIRSAGKTEVAWWNTLRAAIVQLQTVFGIGSTPETAFAFGNGQAVAADVTGAVASASTAKFAKFTIGVRRKTATALSERISWVEFFAAYRDQSTGWEKLDVVTHGDDHGLTLTITAAGQLQYTSDSIAGSTYAGASYFKIETFSP